MQDISYKLDNFEGPMDLLLHLIGKRKLSIWDIPILELVDQYLEYVGQMQVENMELASDFIEMAARLIYIKTVSLLPVHEEADELSMQLRGELSEFSDCKKVAEMLSKRTQGFDYFCRPPQQIEPDQSYTRIHEPLEIYQAYISAAGKGRRKLPPPVESFKSIISKKIVSVASRISYLFAELAVKERLNFKAVFMSSTSRSEMVATFLAMLTLIKQRKIRIRGRGDATEILAVKDETQVI